MPDSALEAAHRLALRQGEGAQIRDVEHRICLSLAHRGDSDRLVSKLLDRRKRGLLGKQEIEEIASAYLDAHRFDLASPWAGFFEQLPQDQLPRAHEVHALLGRFRLNQFLCEHLRTSPELPHRAPGHPHRRRHLRVRQI